MALKQNGVLILINRKWHGILSNKIHFLVYFLHKNFIFKDLSINLSCNAFGKPQNWQAEHCLRVGQFSEKTVPIFFFAKKKY